MVVKVKKTKKHHARRVSEAATISVAAMVATTAEVFVNDVNITNTAKVAANDIWHFFTKGQGQLKTVCKVCS